MRKIYVDCSHTYFSSLNSGIQRVVRNIIKNLSLLNLDENIEIVPVVYSRNKYIEVDKLPNVTGTSKKIDFKNRLKKLYLKIKEFMKFIPFLQKILSSPILISYLNKNYDLITANKKLEGKGVVFEQNDILLLLDSTWMDSDFRYLNNLKNKKIKIISVIYDIIPISHPKYCSDELAKVFSLWLEKIYPVADGFITISETVKEQLYSFLKNKYSDISTKSFEYFVLGVDFKQNKFESEKLDKNYKNLFNKNKTYITVSTLEPRKNHQFILEVFDKIWEKELDFNYVIIGRIGWKVGSLLNRIKTHKQYNKRLFLLDKVDDNALIYAYQNSKAMIFASYIEGFGLPIIESLYYNLQVLASNIPIHKEVGQNHISYFDIKDVNSLVRLLEDDNYQKDIKNFKWYTWSQSTEELFSKVSRMVES